jgi:putative hydrolase of the HAD superfamily
MSTEPVRAVLFDFGHTLVDFQRTEDALREAYERIRERVEAVAYMERHEILDLVERVAGGIDAMIEDSYRAGRLQELDQAELLTEAFASIGFDLPPDVVEHVVALDHSAYSNSITVEPEVLDVLNGLRDGGRRLGLVSNVTVRPDLLRGDLDRLGIGPLLDASVFSSEIGVRKPDPRIFHEAIDRIGAEPSVTAFVGDRLVDDVAGAQAVGMRAIQTRQFRAEEGGEVTPDAVIDHLRELPAALERLGADPRA